MILDSFGIIHQSLDHFLFLTVINNILVLDYNVPKSLIFGISLIFSSGISSMNSDTFLMKNLKP